MKVNTGLALGGNEFGRSKPVEMVQTYDGNTTSPLDFSYPNNSPNNSPEKEAWVRDVCGWLSRPASDGQGNVISPHGNFALVKSFNGSLLTGNMVRLNGIGHGRGSGGLGVRATRRLCRR